MVNYYDELEIEDFAWDPVAKVYHYPCPCGDRFEISKSQLRNGEEIATCPSCSLIVRVVYDYLDWEDYETTDGEEEEEEDPEGPLKEQKEQKAEVTTEPASETARMPSDTKDLREMQPGNPVGKTEAEPPDRQEDLSERVQGLKLT